MVSFDTAGYQKFHTLGKIVAVCAWEPVVGSRDAGEKDRRGAAGRWGEGGGVGAKREIPATSRNATIAEFYSGPGVSATKLAVRKERKLRGGAYFL